MDYSLPAFSALGIFQARILECVATSFFRGIFPIQGSNSHLLCLPPWQMDSYHCTMWEAPSLHQILSINISWPLHSRLLNGKESACQEGEGGSILGGGDTLAKEMATHSSILGWKNPMNRGAWRATVHGVTKSQRWLSRHGPYITKPNQFKINFCCCGSVNKSCQTICDPMVCSLPDSSVPCYLMEFAQIYVHWIGDAT